MPSKSGISSRSSAEPGCNAIVDRRAALAAAGRKRLLLASPKPVMKLAAPVIERAPGRPLSPDAVDFITTDALADPSEIEATLGLKMTPLREALDTYLAPA